MDHIGKNRDAHLANLHDLQCTTKKDALWSFCSIVKYELREMQDSWLSEWAEEIQCYADENHMKNFYGSLKVVYGQTTALSSLLLSADGTKLISEKNKILERRVEHFNDVLNRPSSINEKDIE